MGNWQIVLAEQNMNLGRWDQLIFGQDTCHSYLVLKDPEGEVVSEMHGTTWHPKKKQTQPWWRIITSRGKINL